MTNSQKHLPDHTGLPSNRVYTGSLQDQSKCHALEHLKEFAIVHCNNHIIILYIVTMGKSYILSAQFAIAHQSLKWWIHINCQLTYIPSLEHTLCILPLASPHDMNKPQVSDNGHVLPPDYWIILCRKNMNVRRNIYSHPYCTPIVFLWS